MLKTTKFNNNAVNFYGKGRNFIKGIGLPLMAAMAIRSCSGYNPSSNFQNTQIDNYSKTTTFEGSDIDLDEFSIDYFEYSKNNKEVNEELEKASEEASSYLDIPFFGDYLNRNNSAKIMREAIDNTSGKINGYIDEDVVQGIIADCWLITPVNNLSYTQEGAKAIHDAISYDNNGNILVHLKGPDLTYRVTQEELKENNGEHTLYSVGDDDMLALELAVGKFRQDLKDGKIDIDKSLPKCLYYTSLKDDDYSVLNFGETLQAYWLLAGIKDSTVAHGKKEVSDTLDKFQYNPDKSLLDIELKNDAIVEDVNSNKVCIQGSHGYGVKDVDDDKVTLICATNSQEEIVLSRDTIYNLPLSDVVYCSLDDYEE